MSYIWTDGEIITAEKLNNTGDGENTDIIFVVEALVEEDSEQTEFYDKYTVLNVNKSFNEIKTAYDNNKVLSMKVLWTLVNEAYPDYNTILPLSSIDESVAIFANDYVALNINSDNSTEIFSGLIVTVENIANRLDNTRFLQLVNNNISFSYSGTPITGSYLTCNQNVEDILTAIFQYSLSVRAFFNYRVYELIEANPEGALAFQNVHFSYRMPGLDGPYVIISRITYLTSLSKWVYSLTLFELKNNL